MLIVVEIKDDAWDNGADTCLRADDRMHRRYDVFLIVLSLACMEPPFVFMSVTSLPAKLSQIVQALANTPPRFQ